MNELVHTLLAESSGPAAIGLQDVLLRLLVAFLAGMSVAWVYRASHGTLNYSQNFTQALVLLSLVVSVIMCVVGDSLARAFGLGAVQCSSRIRKDPGQNYYHGPHCSCLRSEQDKKPFEVKSCLQTACQ